MTQPQNVIFWGAGATRSLGILTTPELGKFIQRITGASASLRDEPLKKRVDEALALHETTRWSHALFDLITILGDRNENSVHIGSINDAEREAMGRSCLEAKNNNDYLENRIIDLRLIYDWPALKSIVRICPGYSSESKFKINDLFNILDMHAPGGFGVRAPDQPEGKTKFFDARRLIGAKNALRMLLGVSFYIAYQECIHSKRRELEQYCDFARHLGLRMRRKGIDLAQQHALDDPKFYQSDVCFVSLNYDPIALWTQFIANRELNNDPGVPHIGSPAVPLHLFHDFGHLIPARRIGRGSANWPWYPLNEGVAQRLNESTVSDYRVRLTKFLFPHGCLCWRECPDCGKLSAYHGDEWVLEASGLFPPPPLQAFDKKRCPDWIDDDERNKREGGEVDVRACLHCGTSTYAYHTQTVMQSSFKSQPPSFIEEIQRDLRAATMQANHIIFMGYSLPLDDVIYRAFFSARCQRKNDDPVYCTVVDKSDEHPDWYGPEELENLNLPNDHVVKAACDIFGEKNVRFYGGGVPNVFLDGGRVIDAALERLLDWSST